MKIVADANIPFAEQAFSSLGQVETCDGRKLSAEKLVDADILLVRSVTQVDASLLKNSRVRFVGSATIGVDHIDQAYLKDHSIAFANAPGCNATSAAEYVITALLSMAQNLGFKLQDKTVGIVGCGNVGSRVLDRLASLGVRCLVNDPPRAAQYADRPYVSLNDVIQADIITIHTPLSTEGIYKTHHLFNHQRLTALKSDAIIVNTARGSVVDGSALLSIIQKRPDMNLVLDVWENEPSIDMELLKLAGIATPHIAGYSIDGKVRGTQMIYTAACKKFDHRGTWNVQSVDLPTSSIIDISDAITMSQNLSNDQLLIKVILTAYDLKKDDRNLRKSVKVDKRDRPVYFDSLRKNYPIRREFANQYVKVPAGFTTLTKNLKTLGFQVVEV